MVLRRWFSGEAMVNPVQEIVVIFTDKSDSDNEYEVVVNMELK